MQLLSQVQREVIDSDRDIRSLKERKTYLEGELATLRAAYAAHQRER